MCAGWTERWFSMYAGWHVEWHAKDTGWTLEWFLVEAGADIERQFARRVRAPRALGPADVSRGIEVGFSAGRAGPLAHFDGFRGLFKTDGYPGSMPTVADIRNHGPDDPPLTFLTAYDAPTAAALEEAGIDIILVGDSVGNTMLGYDSTLPVTVDEIASHTGAVVRATDESLVIADMPFMSYGADIDEAIQHCGRMLKEEGAQAIKHESGPHTVELTERLVDNGIPVMAHLGLNPQRVNETGDLTRRATDAEEAAQILELAKQHEEAGAFSLLLEHIPANVAKIIDEELDIPTIGIGAGPHVSGQGLIITDVLGVGDWVPPFAKQYADVQSEMEKGIEGFKREVRNEEYPAEDHYVEESVEGFE
jgi:3-methyl-2-oxobutanoate hydroxymethyltransferase